ncbi:MAG: hypothetical protein ABI151_05215 [Chitinophagaceae bacterium]
MASINENTKDPGKDGRIIENEATRNNESVEERKKNDPEEQPDNLPGYPHYNPREDILDPDNDVLRVDVDVEKITREKTVNNEDILAGAPSAVDSGMEKPADVDPEDDLGIVAGTDADLTPDDLLALGAIDEDMDMGDDEAMATTGPNYIAGGDDLDVPGDELDDKDEAIGEEDEENNYYSLGGESKDSLEEDNADTIDQ